MLELDTVNSSRSVMIGTTVNEPVKFRDGLTEKQQNVYDTFLKVLKWGKESEKLKLSDRNVFAFILKHHASIFNNIDLKQTKKLREKELCKFLISVFREIRVQGLADEKNLHKVQAVVVECLKSTRRRRAWAWVWAGVTSFIGLFPGTESLKKIPYLGKFLGGEEKKKESSESAEKIVGKIVFKVALSAVFLALAISGGPIAVIPYPIVLGGSIIGLVYTVCTTIQTLVENRKGSISNPSEGPPTLSSHDDPKLMLKRAKGYQQAEENKKQRKLEQKISDLVNDVLNAPVKTESKETDNTSDQAKPGAVGQPDKTSTTHPTTHRDMVTGRRNSVIDNEVSGPRP